MQHALPISASKLPPPQQAEPVFVLTFAEAWPCCFRYAAAIDPVLPAAIWLLPYWDTISCNKVTVIRCGSHTRDDAWWAQTISSRSVTWYHRFIVEACEVLPTISSLFFTFILLPSAFSVRITLALTFTTRSSPTKAYPSISHAIPSPTTQKSSSTTASRPSSCPTHAKKNRLMPIFSTFPLISIFIFRLFLSPI